MQAQLRNPDRLMTKLNTSYTYQLQCQSSWVRTSEQLRWCLPKVTNLHLHSLAQHDPLPLPTTSLPEAYLSCHRIVYCIKVDTAFICQIVEYIFCKNSLTTLHIQQANSNGLYQNSVRSTFLLVSKYQVNPLMEVGGCIV